MPLFRRKRGTPGEESPTGAPVAPESPARSGRRARSPTASVAIPPAPVASPVAAPTPPPLPVPPAPPAASLDASPDYSECFVCGTTLEGKTCPKCQMTWVE